MKCDAEVHVGTATLFAIHTRMVNYDSTVAPGQIITPGVSRLRANLSAMLLKLTALSKRVVGPVPTGVELYFSSSFSL